MNTIIRSIPSLLAGLFATGAFAAEVETITIKTLRAQMRYDVTGHRGAAGAEGEARPR